VEEFDNWKLSNQVQTLPNLGVLITSVVMIVILYGLRSHDVKR